MKKTQNYWGGETYFDDSGDASTSSWLGTLRSWDCM